MSDADAVEVLCRSTAGVLALNEEGGYPYAVPVSYVYSDGKIYFHSALKGHKAELLERCDKVSFCVIDKDDVKPEEFTTYFRSVIVFGRARIITDDAEKMKTLRLLGHRYSPGDDDGLAAETAKGFGQM